MGNCFGHQELYCQTCLLNPWKHANQTHKFIPNLRWLPWKRWPTWQDEEAWRINCKFNETSHLADWIVSELPNKPTIYDSNITVVVISNGNWDFTLYSEYKIIAKGYCIWGSGICKFINIYPSTHVESYPPELLEDFNKNVI